METTISSCDVLVIGAGPGGASISTLLAEKGWQVTMLEKDQHPRFHIGESLLPMNMPLFEKLGVQDEIAAIGVPKPGAEFNSIYHNKSLTYYFSGAMDATHPTAYQVRRSDFDHVLVKNSVRRGVTLKEQTKVTEISFRPGQNSLVTAIDAQGNKHQWDAKFVVDASGRDTFLANLFGIKKRNPKHNSAALFGHFEGVTRFCGKDEGNISLYWFDHGWFWIIPLQNGITSVGAVCWPYYLKSRKNDLQSFFHDTIALSPGVSERLKDAKLVSEVTATGNYSYESKNMAGPGYLMVGDAFAFVDPVFSSGVYLAMNSAFLGAEVVDDVLKKSPNAGKALRRYDKTVRHGVKTFSWFIYRVTTPAMRHLLLNPREYFNVRAGITSLLAGDIFSATPVASRILFFKFVYYMTSLGMARKSFAAFKQRRENLKPVHAG